MEAGAGETSITPTLDEDGKTYRLDGKPMIYMKRKIADEALKTKREGYRLICSNPMLGVSWASPDGILLKANEAFANMLGLR